MSKNRSYLYSSKSPKLQYMWFIAGGIAFSSTTFVFQLLVTRKLGIIWAGDFSVAYSISQLAMIIGMFGMRTYQVSDIKNKFSFEDYWWSRIFSLALMFAYILFNIVTSTYTKEKILIILLMSIYRVFDVLPDVYQGLFQQRGDLGDAGRTVAIKSFGSMIIFTAILLITGNLFFSLIGACVSALLIFCILEINIIKRYKEVSYSYNFCKIKKLLAECLPLCLSTFLNMYILSLPKFSIEKFLDNEIQAVYAILYMVFMVLNLCAGFILKPLLGKFSILYETKDISKLNKYVSKIITLGIIFSVFVGFCIYVCGTQVMGLIYGVELIHYRVEMLFMFIAGIINMGITLFTYLLTVLRKQRLILYFYFIISIVAYVVSNLGTYYGGIKGCTFSNILIEIFLFILLLFSYLGFTKKLVRYDNAVL